MIPRFW